MRTIVLTAAIACCSCAKPGNPKAKAAFNSGQFAECVLLIESSAVPADILLRGSARLQLASTAYSKSDQAKPNFDALNAAQRYAIDASKDFERLALLPQSSTSETQRREASTLAREAERIRRQARQPFDAIENEKARLAQLAEQDRIRKDREAAREAEREKNEQTQKQVDTRAKNTKAASSERETELQRRQTIRDAYAAGKAALPLFGIDVEAKDVIDALDGKSKPDTFVPRRKSGVIVESGYIRDPVSGKAIKTSRTRSSETEQSKRDRSEARSKNAKATKDFPYQQANAFYKAAEAIARSKIGFENELAADLNSLLRLIQAKEKSGLKNQIAEFAIRYGHTPE